MLETTSFQSFQFPEIQDPHHQYAWIDVRSENEFMLGHIPGFTNLPILTNEQRHLVGTCYKQKGKKAAIDLGLQLTSIDKNAKIAQWSELISKTKTKKAFISCFRGGLRSRFAVDWLVSAGFEVYQIKGGYKLGRQKILEQLASPPPFLVLSGKTGSSKTKLIETYSQNSLNLENHARHRGSAFGSLGEQPSQAVFENKMAFDFLKFNLRKEKKILIEDESRHIGRILIPDSVFKAIRTSEMLFIEETVEKRAENIFNEYILESKLGFENSKLENHFLNRTESLRKKLGNLETDNILKEIKKAFTVSKQSKKPTFSEHHHWILRLLTCYYDPRYEYGFEKDKQNRKILFRGTYKEIEKWILENKTQIF